MKKMKPYLLWSWSFIIDFTDGILDGIININIFKFFIGDAICKVKIKLSIRIKFFRNPFKY